MSTSNLASARFDDSEDEDDNFNPQPADISDNEDAARSNHDDDAGAQIRNEASSRRVDDESDDEETSNPRSKPVEEDADEDDEDAEGEGEDIAPGAHDDDDEDDEEDEEEEIDTVCAFLLQILGNGALQGCLKFEF